jgi:hypothetical protein
MILDLELLAPGSPVHFQLIHKLWQGPRSAAQPIALHYAHNISGVIVGVSRENDRTTHVTIEWTTPERLRGQFTILNTNDPPAEQLARMAAFLFGGVS